MMRAIRLTVVCIVALVATESALRAGIITFDPLPTVSTSGGRLVGNDANFAVDGLHVEAFWRTGTSFVPGHFHFVADGLGTGNVESQHFNTLSDLQGFFIENLDGSAFSLASLDYRVSGTTSISGFSSADVKVLIATDFDPAQSVANQFTAFSVGLPSSSYATLLVTGFENVTRVYIASSASVRFDNIVTGPAVSDSAVPEPSSLALLGIGAIGAGISRARRRRS